MTVPARTSRARAAAARRPPRPPRVTRLASSLSSPGLRKPVEPVRPGPVTVWASIKPAPIQNLNLNLKNEKFPNRSYRLVNGSNWLVNRSNRSVYRSEPVAHAILNLDLNSTGFRSNRSGKPLPEGGGLTGPVVLFNPGCSSLKIPSL